MMCMGLSEHRGFCTFSSTFFSHQNIPPLRCCHRFVVTSYCQTLLAKGLHLSFLVKTWLFSGFLLSFQWVSWLELCLEEMRFFEARYGDIDRSSGVWRDGKGGQFIFFFAAGFGFFLGSWFYAFLFLWFSAFLLLCFSASMLFCFSAFLLLCFSCFSCFSASAFPASLLFCFLLFLLLCFSASLFSQLLCFCTSVPFYFYYSTFSFLQSCVFAAPLPAPLLPVFTVSLFFIFFCFILFCLYPKWNPRETLGETQRNPKEILIRNPTWSPKWTLKKP